MRVLLVIASRIESPDRNNRHKCTRTAPGLQTAEFSRILLIKPSALGDVVHTVPVLVKLRARYPRARIDWLITPENAEVVRHHPALSNVVLFARRDFSKPGQRWRATLGFFDLLKQIRRAKYDLVVDMHGQVRSALFALISGARVRIGFNRPINSRAQFLPSTISRTFRTAAGAAPVKVPGSRTLTAFPFRRSMFTRLIVTCGSDRCLVSMMNRRIWQSISHRKQSTTSSDCSRARRACWQTARCSCARDNLGNKALDHRRICRRRARVSSPRICCCSRGYETR